MSDVPEGGRETPRVLVMMATCNGERHLSEQVDSVLAQQGVRVSLRVCDDLSDDTTYAILSDYASRCENVKVSQNRSRLGVGLNFMQMVYEADSEEFDYFAFSDQDDVWLPEKLAVAGETIDRLEASRGRTIPGIGMPVLYCSDLMNVDERLNNPTSELEALVDDNLPASPLVRNRYSGCTMVFNRAQLLLMQSFRPASFPRIHDAWSYLIAFYCGNVVVDRNHALILRRITGANQEGATVPGKDVKNASVVKVFSHSERSRTAAASLLLKGYGRYMDEETRGLVESFCKYRNNIFSRMHWAFSNSYESLSWLDTLLVRTKFLIGRI